MTFNESMPKDSILDRIQAMMIQEARCYDYYSYFPEMMTPEEIERQAHLNGSWREKICQWSYNVVDHFDLPREVVAVSLDLFDRYIATRGNQCNGNMALLASLTTLHIAIKVHSEKNIKVCTLASLSRGQFGSRHIEQMEWEIMIALGWKLHPPTLFAFVSHLLMLFPTDIHHSVRKELFEIAIYMAELSVCDSFFVKYPASTVAMAAIMNVMDDLPKNRLTTLQRDAFWSDLYSGVQGFNSDDITIAQERLRSMFSCSASSPPTTCPDTNQPSNSAQPSGNYETNVTTSPTSTTDMQVDETTSIASSSCADSSFFRSNVRSNCDKDQYRYSPSPTNRRHAASPMSCTRSRIASSPIVAGIH